jgi:hypothetical protein
MNDNPQTTEKEKEKMSFFEHALEVVGWLQIVASPLLGGLMIGAVVYFSNPTICRLVIAISMATIGLIAGIIFATRAWKKQGTMYFISRIMATPELDTVDEEKK